MAYTLKYQQSCGFIACPTVQDGSITIFPANWCQAVQYQFWGMSGLVMNIWWNLALWCKKEKSRHVINSHHPNKKTPWMAQVCHISPHFHHDWQFSPCTAQNHTVYRSLYAEHPPDNKIAVEFPETAGHYRSRIRKYYNKYYCSFRHNAICAATATGFSAHGYLSQHAMTNCCGAVQTIGNNWFQGVVVPLSHCVWRPHYAGNLVSISKLNN